MNRWPLTFAVVVCSLPCALPAQQISGPVLGYVWDGDALQVRPVRGIPGAASMGDAVATGQRLLNARMAGGADFAVVLTSARTAALLSFGSATLAPLPGIHSGIESFELSPSGSSAAFYFVDNATVEVVSGIPERPSHPAYFSLAPLRHPLDSFRVSDDGALLLALESGDDGAAVVLNPSGDVNRIELAGRITAAAFLPGTHDALLASAREVVLVRNAATSDRFQVRTSLTPTAIAALDGRRALLADAAGRVAVVDLESGETTVVAGCDCTPSVLARMSGRHAYRLTEYSNSPMRLLDLSGERPRVVSVPPRIASDRQP